MIMETLTISRLLERILRKEFHKVQDVVKKKTKAVETIGRQDIAASDSSLKVFSFYVLRYVVEKYFMYFV